MKQPSVIMTKAMLASLCVLFSVSSHGNTVLQEQVKVYQQALDAREYKKQQNKLKLDNLKLKANDFVPANRPNIQVVVHKNPLPCHKTTFVWGGKTDNYEYQDCIFKVDYEEDDQVARYVGAIQEMGVAGWEVEKTEFTNQLHKKSFERYSKEKYRFKRKLNGDKK